MCVSEEPTGRRRHAWSAQRAPLRCSPDEVQIAPTEDLSGLAEMRGRLRGMKHSKGFLAGVFDERDKQLFPRDLLTLRIPTRRAKSGAQQTGAGPQPDAPPSEGSRAVGFLRRSLKFDKSQMRAALYIDFVWVLPELRGHGLGRRLLEAGLVLGKQKDVRLLVAGSDENRVAVQLCRSLGFEWTSALRTEMLLEKHRVQPVANALPDCRGGDGKRPETERVHTGNGAGAERQRGPGRRPQPHAASVRS